MLRYAIRQLLVLAVVLLAASFVVFAAMFIAPGSPDAVLFGNHAVDPAVRAAVHAKYHLDDPFLVRYVHWLGGVLHGDLGISLAYRQPVGQRISAAAPTTLLLVGYAGAFRRSELSSLRVEDVEFVEDGATVLLRRSKTDQEGKGDKRALPYGSHPQTCPVRNLRRWLEVLSEAEGPIFRPIDRHGNLGEAALSDRSVCEVVKRRAQAAGLSRDRYSGHSLRAGLATAASAAGVSQRSIMDQGDWKSVQTVMRYVREGALFKNNAAASIGL
jgi:hypothetical protein